MRNYCRKALMMLLAVVIFGATIEMANAAVTITGTTGAKYLVSGMPVSTVIDAVLKITFETRTSGTNLSLCAGTMADFSAGKCTINLSKSGGPGYAFLTIIDAKALVGKVIYVIRNVGTVNSQFVLTIE